MVSPPRSFHNKGVTSFVNMPLLCCCVMLRVLMLTTCSFMFFPHQPSPNRSPSRRRKNRRPRQQQPRPVPRDQRPMVMVARMVSMMIDINDDCLQVVTSMGSTSRRVSSCLRTQANPASCAIASRTDQRVLYKSVSCPVSPAASRSMPRTSVVQSNIIAVSFFVFENLLHS